MHFSQMSKLGLPDFHLAQASRQKQYVFGTEVTEQSLGFLSEVGSWTNLSWQNICALSSNLTTILSYLLLASAAHSLL